jgi:hypothetical protein
MQELTYLMLAICGTNMAGGRTKGSQCPRQKV